jgi:Polyketide cyclase / dehydrase and lipid transport
MRSHTTSIAIESPPAQAFAFVADGAKLPVWAIGFAKAIEPDGDRWLVTLASGERVPLRIDSDARTGVVDYVMLPAPDVEAPAHTRVVPHAGGTLYTFSMHQTPEIPDEVFEAQVAELERELSVLKAHLETACPL